MPPGIYPRPATNPAISRAAKGRGQTGFLHPIKHWRVTAAGKHCADEWKTTIKRTAMQKYRALVKDTKYQGRYFKARIRIECDGEEIESYIPWKLDEAIPRAFIGWTWKMSAEKYKSAFSRIETRYAWTWQ
jgi:hypothetical protein